MSERVREILLDPACVHHLNAVSESKLLDQWGMLLLVSVCTIIHIPLFMAIDIKKDTAM